MSVQSIFQNPKKQILFLGSVWALAQLICFFLWGTQTGLESVKYIRAAEYFLQHGNFPEKRYWFYSITTFLIAFSKWINAGNGIVFFTQLVLSLFAHITFFNALKSQTRENHPAPLITTAVLCMILPYQRWNFSLYTESLFYSLVLLFFSFCIVSSHESKKQLWRQLILLIFVVLARPLGILILIPWLIYRTEHGRKQQKRLVSFLYAFGLFLFICICEIILSNIGGYQTLEAYRQGNIICGIPTFETTVFSAGFETTKSSILNLLLYIIENPVLFLTLTWKKTIAFFLMIREYYHWKHNVFLVCICVVSYLPIIIQLFKKSIKKSLFPYFIILSFYLAVILQCDDYHNRFILTLMPIFLYVGLFRLIQRMIH